MRRSFMRWIAAVLTTSMILGGSVTPVSALETAETTPEILSEELTGTLKDEGFTPDRTGDDLDVETMAESIPAEGLTDDQTEEAADDILTETVDTVSANGTEDKDETEDDLAPEGNEGAEPVWDGYIPERYLNAHDDGITIESSEAALEEIPEGSLESRYITSTDYIPDLRDQDPFGTCWTFSVMAANEGYLIKNKGKARTIDLSERALCYFLYDLKGINDPLGNTLGDYNIPNVPNKDANNIYDLGGNAFQSAIFLANWGLPIDESRAPYSELAKLGKNADLTDSLHKGVDALDDKLCYDSEFHLQGFRLINDPAGIKQAIKENGIAATAYFHDSGRQNKYHINFYNQNTHAYNSGSYHTNTVNHIVSIIGWDDNYDKRNFNAACRPQNNGAWLIRNSWGSDWGEGGNFWLSYEDKSFDGIVTFMPEDKNNYDNNYFYDGASGSEGYGRGSVGTWRAANVFKAASDESLEAVSIGIATTDVDYTVQIYKNLTDPEKPDSGTPMLTEEVKGKFTYQGYYTVPLNTSIDLKKGDTFAVVFTLSNPDKETYAYVEKDGVKLDWIKFVAQIDKGQSFYSGSPNSWYDIANTGNCFRIHAFTKNGASKPAHDAEPINAELYRIDATYGKARLSDFSASLNKVLTDKYGVDEAAKWAFKDPDTVITANNDQPTIKVDVVRTEGSNKTYDYILMNVTDVSFDALENIKPTMYTGSDPVKIETYASFIGYDLKKDLLSNFETSDVNVIKPDPNGTFAYIVGEGTATVSSNLFIAGSQDPIKTVTKTVTVTKDPKAEVYVSGNVVKVGPASVTPAETATASETTEKTSFDSITDGYLIVRGYKYYLEDLTDGYTTVFVSEDPSVLKIGKPDKTTRRSELIILGTGYVNVSCKVDGKVIRTLRFNVTMPSVSLEKTALTFNSALTDSTDLLDIYASADIVSVNVVDKNMAAVNDFAVYQEEGRTYCVKYTGSAAALNLNGYLKIKLNGSSEDIYRPVNLKVKNVVPKATVKQLAKVDTTYSNPAFSIGNLSVTLNTGEVEEIRLKDTGRNRGPLAYSIYDSWYDEDEEENVAYGSDFSLYCISGNSVKNNKGTLEIWVDGYKSPINKDITIAYMKSNIKAKAINTGVLTGVSGNVLSDNRIRFSVTNTTNKRAEEYYDPMIGITDKRGSSLTSKYTGVYEGNGVFSLVPKADTKISASGEDVFVTVSDDVHTASVRIKLRVKGIAMAKAALKLEKTSMQLQRYNSISINKMLEYDMGISFKDCGGLSDRLKVLSINGMNPASTAAVKDNKLKLEYIPDESVIRVSYPNGNAPAAGTYKFRLSISKDKTGAPKDIFTTLTVKIKDTPLTAACGTRLKGKIDVLDRDSSVEITPKFKNMPTDRDRRITDVSIAGAGSDKFDIIYWPDDGKVELYLEEGASVSTRDKYEFIITYRIDAGDGYITAVSGKIRIPVTQGAVKSRISSKSVYSNMLRTQKEKFDVTLYNKAGNEVDIDKIELVNPNSDFELIKEGAQYYIGYTPNGAVKRGRSYTLKLNVYPKGKATNTKPVRLTYKVTVAK